MSGNALICKQFPVDTSYPENRLKEPVLSILESPWFAPWNPQ
jgi:hypothetical protein